MYGELSPFAFVACAGSYVQAHREAALSAFPFGPGDCQTAPHMVTLVELDDWFSVWPCEQAMCGVIGMAWKPYMPARNGRNVVATTTLAHAPHLTIGGVGTL